MNRVYSLITQQQERQVFGDQSKVMIATSKGGYNNNITTYGMDGGYGRGNYGGGYTSKICSYCGKTGHTIDTCYKKRGFHLISNLKIKTIIKVMQPFTIQILTIMSKMMKVQS